MHKAQQYIDSFIYPGVRTNLSLLLNPISATKAFSLDVCIKSDGADYIYSAAISVGEAIRGLCNGLTSWATVKLYYATFYSLRAILAFDGTCIFYIGRKPYSLAALAGSVPKKNEGTTHKVVIKVFKNLNIEPRLLSQQIDLQCPLEWLMENRERANYKFSRFIEPMIPNCFEIILSKGIRRSLHEYLIDTSMMHAFDPDHAMVAYPLTTLRIACKRFVESGIGGLQFKEKSLLRSLFQDNSGPLSELIRLFDDL